MKQTEENGGLRRISKEEVEQIINSQPASMANSLGCGCGCGCGCGSGSGDDWRVVGCGNGTSIDMGSGSGMPGVDRDNPNPYNIHLG